MGRVRSVSASRSVTPWVWAGLIWIGGITALVLGPVENSLDLVEILLALLLTALASVIGSRQPGNRIASLLHVQAGVLLLEVFGSHVAEASQPPVSPGAWDLTAIVVFNVVSNLIVYPVLLILFTFPTGRFLTRRWRWAGWLATVFSAALLFVSLFVERMGKFYDPADENWYVDNPIGFLPTELGEAMTAQSVGVMMWLGLGGLVAMVVRYRRSETLVRTQIKWVVYASTLAAAMLFSISLTPGDEVLYLLQVLGPLVLIPVAITVAITRYKLFEIDRLISRTVTYALVVGLLAVVFAAGVIWIPAALGLEGSPLLVAGSTLAVAALFNPLRKRVQGAVDRRFNRSGYQMEVVSERFATELREPHTVEEIAALWKGTVDDSLQPRASGIWLSDDD